MPTSLRALLFVVGLAAYVLVVNLLIPAPQDYVAGLFVFIAVILYGLVQGIISKIRYRNFHKS